MGPVLLHGNHLSMCLRSLKFKKKKGNMNLAYSFWGFLSIFSLFQGMVVWLRGLRQQGRKGHMGMCVSVPPLHCLLPLLGAALTPAVPSLDKKPITNARLHQLRDCVRLSADTQTQTIMKAFIGKKGTEPEILWG